MTTRIPVAVLAASDARLARNLEKILAGYSSALRRRAPAEAAAYAHVGADTAARLGVSATRSRFLLTRQRRRRA